MSVGTTKFYYTAPGGEPVEILNIENVEPIAMPEGDLNYAFTPQVLEFEATFTGRFPVGFWRPCKIMKPQHRLIGRRSHD